MKVLVVGGGGREHALVRKLAESSRVEKIWCAPGNGGIAGEAECVAIDSGDVAGLVAFAEKNLPDLTVVGPEVALVNGIADAFRDRGWAIVGPSRYAAQLEGSKVFSKEFLQRHRIPTAKMYGTFEAAPEAYAALESVTYPLVIKADGLCAGKGVLLAQDATEAKHFLQSALEKRELGAGGSRVMLEETLQGQELSFIILTDGERFAALAPTRDHKRIFDGDAGPNTGGMGAYSTDSLLPDALYEEIVSKIVEPTLHGLAADGIRYQGFLYIGIMLTADGPKVLEYNCRLGDPETQAIAARMDFDLAEVLWDAAKGSVDGAKLKWKPGASVCVVVTAPGYPGKFTAGDRIEGLREAESIPGVAVLQAGTKRQDGSVVTNGGRVLGVTAAAPSLPEALQLAYSGVRAIHFAGMHYRKDIGAH